jgi:hypothetical protein
MMELTLDLAELAKNFEQMFPMQYTIVVQKMQIEQLQRMIEDPEPRVVSTSQNGSVHDRSGGEGGLS